MIVVCKPEESMKYYDVLWKNTVDLFRSLDIPVRTLEDWEAARRTPPEYIPRLIAYQLKYEELVKERGEK